MEAKFTGAVDYLDLKSLIEQTFEPDFFDNLHGGIVSSTIVLNEHNTEATESIKVDIKFEYEPKEGGKLV